MKVELINYMGSDLMVVNAARVSFDKESTTLSDKDEKLIKYLAVHNHWTPFAHCIITLRETIPIFVARQRIRHTVGFSYNEVSRRYVDSEPEFAHIVWRRRAENKKQGSADEFGMEGQMMCNKTYDDIIQKVQAAYVDLLDEGVCPEQARAVLPLSTYTSWYVTGSLAAWARAYKLRIHPHAQAEIQQLAWKWNDTIKPLFPVSWAALISDEETAEIERLKSEINRLYIELDDPHQP